MKTGMMRANNKNLAQEIEAEAEAVVEDVVISAMRMIPREIQDLPDGPAKLKALADSRRLMGLTLAGYGRLELAFLAESEEQVEEALDFLKEIKAESHEKYNRGE